MANRQRQTRRSFLGHTALLVAGGVWTASAFRNRAVAAPAVEKRILTTLHAGYPRLV